MTPSFFLPNKNNAERNQNIFSATISRLLCVVDSDIDINLHKNSEKAKAEAWL